MPTDLVEAVRDGDRVLPGHRVHHQQHVVRRDLAPDRLELSSNASSMWSRPAVSRISGVSPREAASSRAARQISSGVWPGSPVTGTLELGAERAELVHRRRALVSAAASNGCCPCFV